MCDGFLQCEVAGQLATWLTALGTIGAVIAALTSEWWRDKLYGPLLDLSFGNTPDYITTTTETFEGTKEVACMACYVRIRVRNRRKAVAKKCRAYLINVEKFDSEMNSFAETLYCDSIRLKWSCQGTHDAALAALDLPQEVNQYVDLLSTRSDGRQFVVQMKPLLNRYAYLFSERGIFRFTVLVTANRVKPKRIKIVFEWAGVWNEFKAYKA